MSGVPAFCAGLGAAHADEVTFYGALTSDYVFRGISNSDGHGALQLGVDVNLEFGLFGGVWASTTDINTGNGNRSREVDYYFGYERYFGRDWSVSVSVNRYTYPGSSGNFSYDYSEYTASIGFADRIWLVFDHANSIFGHDAAADNVEILANWPLPAQYSVTAGIGYFDVSDFAGNEYTYWQVGVSRPVGWATLDLRYHDTNNAPPRISPRGLADPRLVIAISVAF